MGRSSRTQAEENRNRIVEVASRLFRAHGVESVGIADVMKAAGMTQGGFYRHFSSKDALAAEACALAFQDAAERWRDVAKRTMARGGDVAAAIVAYYLEPKPADSTCPMIALNADAARSAPSDKLANAYGAGVQLLFTTFVQVASANKDDAELGLLYKQFSSMVGANMLARSSPAAGALAQMLVH